MSLYQGKGSDHAREEDREDSWLQQTSGPPRTLASEKYLESLLKITGFWAFRRRISRVEPRNCFLNILVESGVQQ